MKISKNPLNFNAAIMSMNFWLENILSNCGAVAKKDFSKVETSTGDAWRILIITMRVIMMIGMNEKRNPKEQASA